jgi:hypothetical protein
VLENYQSRSTIVNPKNHHRYVLIVSIAAYVAQIFLQISHGFTISFHIYGNKREETGSADY